MRRLKQAAIIAGLGLASALAQAQDRLMILDVTVNGQHIPIGQEIGHSAKGHWSIPLALWNDLRLGTPPQLITDGPLAGHVDLSQIAGLQMDFDAGSQALAIVFPVDSFQTFHVAGSQADAVSSITAVGAYANYDVQVSHSPGQTTLTGAVDLVGFAPGIRISSSSYIRPQGFGGKRFLRLDTGAEFTNTANSTSLRVGDQVSSSGLWGRSTRMAGFGFGSRLSMRPTFVPFARPTVRGEAILPSTLEVLVDQYTVASEQVPAGPFEWNDLPVMTGKGDIRFTMTDLQGRKTEVVQPYLVSDQLLRPGLSDFSFEAGVIREDYGSRSDNYGRTAVLAQHKLGLSEQLTSEVRAESLPSQKTVGAGVVLKIAEWGVAQATAAASRKDGANGHALSAGLDVPGNLASIQLRSTRSSRFFAQLGADDPHAAIRSTDRVGVFVPWSRGSMGFTWMSRKFWNADPERFWLLSATASLGERIMISAYLQSSLFEKKQRTVGVNLIVPLDADSQLWSQAARTSGQTTGGIGWVSNLHPGIGWGHRIYADEDGRITGTVDRREAAIDWNASLDLNPKNTSLGLGISGSLVFLGGQLLPSRRIESGFGVIKVGDLPGVPVYQDHHKIGVTGSDGMVVLNNLRPYEPNTIQIDPNDLPMDAQFGQLELKLSPALGSGVLANMGVSMVRPRNFIAQTANGKPLPPGTLFRVVGQISPRTVGYGGKLFEPDWQPGMVYEGLVANQPCRLIAPSSAKREAITTLQCESAAQ